MSTHEPVAGRERAAPAARARRPRARRRWRRRARRRPAAAGPSRRCGQRRVGEPQHEPVRASTCSTAKPASAAASSPASRCSPSAAIRSRLAARGGQLVRHAPVLGDVDRDRVGDDRAVRRVARLRAVGQPPHGAVARDDAVDDLHRVVGPQRASRPPGTRRRSSGCSARTRPRRRSRDRRAARRQAEQARVARALPDGVPPAVDAELGPVQHLVDRLDDALEVVVRVRQRLLGRPHLGDVDQDAVGQHPAGGVAARPRPLVDVADAVGDLQPEARGRSRRRAPAAGSPARRTPGRRDARRRAASCAIPRGVVRLAAGDALPARARRTTSATARPCSSSSSSV